MDPRSQSPRATPTRGLSSDKKIGQLGLSNPRGIEPIRQWPNMKGYGTLKQLRDDRSPYSESKALMYNQNLLKGYP